MYKNKKKKKAPQIAITVLLFACPVALAEQAQAQTRSTSYDRALLGEQRQLSLHQIGTANQSLLPLGMSPNQSLAQFPFASPLSLVSSLTKEEYQIEVEKATATLNSAKKALITAQNRLDTLTANKDKAQDALDASKTAFDTATDLLDTLKADTDGTSDDLDAAKEALDTALDNLTSAKEALQSATDEVSDQTATTESAQASLATAQATLTTASANLQTAQTNYNLASTNFTNKTSALQSAQTAYNNSQVPNPNYVSPYTTNTIPNLLFNSDFSRGNEGWSGLSIGWQNSQPGYFNGNIVFSYINQTVTQGLYSGPFPNATLTLSAEWYNDDSNRNFTDSYSMTVSAQDINQNPVGSATFTSNNTRHGWETKSVALVATGPVSYITVSFSGIDNGFWAGNYGPHLRNPQLQVSSQTPTNNAPATQTGTVQVDIAEGQGSTFTAPNGGIFTSSNLRYEAIDDPTCGANVTPEGFGSNTITLAADNGVWGDTCGGWYKRLVGTLTYSTNEPQFIKDPNLYTALQTAQSQYASAQSAYETAQSSLEQAQTTKDTAQSSVETQQSYVTDYQTDLLNLQSSKDLAASEVDDLQSVYDSAQSAHEAEQSKLEAFQSALDKAQDDYDTAEANYETAQDNFANLETEFDSASADVEEATNDLDAAQEELDSIPEPEEEPEEPKAPEIPEGDPKDLTEEEVTELVAEAEAVLESAEQGSPQYEQALEALAVAADADDPEISSELAAIPLLGDAAAATLEILNNLGNVGADMAPAVREEAEKTVIASVIATGAAVNAVQAAAGAAATAAATTSTSTSGSSSGGGGGASGSSSSSSTRKPKA